MYFVESISEEIWKLLHSTLQSPPYKIWGFVAVTIHTVALWMANILDKRTDSILKIEVSLRCWCMVSSLKRTENESSMLWKLQPLCTTEWQLSVSWLVSWVMTVCRYWMCDTGSYDSRLSTEGSDLASFMSKNAPSANSTQNFCPFMGGGGRERRRRLFKTVTKSIYIIPFQVVRLYCDTSTAISNSTTTHDTVGITAWTVQENIWKKFFPYILCSYWVFF